MRGLAAFDRCNARFTTGSRPGIAASGSDCRPTNPPGRRRLLQEAAPSYGAGSWSGRFAGASTKRTSNIFGHHFPVI